jgi:hypothetical protein
MQNQIIFDVSMKISFSLTFAQAFKRIALYRLIQLLVTLDSGMHSIVARWIFADNAMNALRDCPNGDNRPIRKGESNRKPSRKERAEMDEPIKRKCYPSDLTDAQWEMIEPSIPAVSAEATGADHRATRDRECDPPRPANRMLVEADASRPAQWEDSASLLPHLEPTRHVGADHGPLAQTCAC